MASTNKTPNLNLSQFIGSDKLQRVDYNADMLKIDTAVKANQDAAGDASTAASSAQNTADNAAAAASAAQSTADNALGAAQRAQEAIDYLTLDNVPDGETRKLGDAQSIAGVPVDVDGLSVGQTLVYDGDNFVPADGGTGDANRIDGIPVDLGGMTDGQTLVLSDGTLVPGSGGGTDDIWLPNVDEDGDISWSRSSSETPPTTRNIKGGDGQNGAKWYSGETAPTGANTGDYWLSTSLATLGNVYRFNGADWELQVNIKGQDGTGSGDMLWAAWRAIYDPTASGKALAQVYDGLDSTSATLALTAAQGKALADMIGDIGGVLDNINGEVV